MNDTRTTLPVGLKHILASIYADPEAHLPELMGWMDHMYPAAEQSGSAAYAMLKRTCADRESEAYHWLCRLFRDIDAQTLFHLAENYILHADWARQHAAGEADHRSLACLLDDERSTIGQCGDTIFSFDALDTVITEERARGIHRFLCAGGEPLEHKRELIAAANKHSRCTFWVLTGGELIDDRFARDLLRTGNMVPILTNGVIGAHGGQKSDPPATTAAASLLHTFRVLFGILVAGPEAAEGQGQDRAHGAKEVLLMRGPNALGFGTPQGRTIERSREDPPRLTLPVRLWRRKKEIGQEARLMMEEARRLVIDFLGFVGMAKGPNEGSRFAHILRLREVAPL